MLEFNGQFTDVFTKSEYSQVPLLDRSAPFMEDIVVTKEGVIKLLKGLNPSKALGPDELHPRVLKELATELGPIFAHLFQQSIDSGDISKACFTSALRQPCTYLQGQIPWFRTAASRCC